MGVVCVGVVCVECVELLLARHREVVDVDGDLRLLLYEGHDDAAGACADVCEVVFYESS